MSSVDLRASALAYLLWAKRRYIAQKRQVGEHRVKQMARILGLDPPPSPRLWIAPAREAEAASLVPQGAPVLAIGPAANWRGKEWRAERFAELAQRLTAPGGLFPGARVAVMAAAHERPQAMPLIDALGPRAIDLVGKIRSPDGGRGDQAQLRFSSATIPASCISPRRPARRRSVSSGRARSINIRPGDRTRLSSRPRSRIRDLIPPDFDRLTTDTLMDSLSVDMAEEAARRLWARVAGKAA